MPTIKRQHSYTGFTGTPCPVCRRTVKAGDGYISITGEIRNSGGLVKYIIIVHLDCMDELVHEPKTRPYHKDPQCISMEYVETLRGQIEKTGEVFVKH